jgi:hypothetical protein
MAMQQDSRFCLQFALLVLVPVFACSSQGAPRNSESQSSGARTLLAVLGSPPEDTREAVWDSLTVPANVLVNPPSFTGRIVRNALYVHFRRDASAAARASAIARISGEIIGGRRINAFDGFYLVRIPITAAPGDSSSGPLLRARKLLDADQSVRGTLILSLDPL